MEHEDDDENDYEEGCEIRDLKPETQRREGAKIIFVVKLA